MADDGNDSDRQPLPNMVRSKMNILSSTGFKVKIVPLLSKTMWRQLSWR